jgi:Raf kinase inhibitor-like YbhB/YbcL family protein
LEVNVGLALSHLEITSPAFGPGQRLPTKYTGEGEGISPPLRWARVPDATQSFALVCHDPDAPVVSSGTYGFTHWVIYNIPSSITSLAEGTTEFTSGLNDFGKSGYGPPMPPKGHGEHHYFFWLFALDQELGLEPGLTQGQVLHWIEPYTIGMNRLIGFCETV